MSLKSWLHSKKRLCELNGSMSNTIYKLREDLTTAHGEIAAVKLAFSETRAKLLQSEVQIAGLKHVADFERTLSEERGEELEALSSRLNVALAQLKTEKRRSAAYKGRMK